MKRSPFISVIMPVYNAEKYLQESISSVLGQSFSDLELILVNDCSTDGSGKLCDALANSDERIKVVHLQDNVGAGMARNKGLDLACGEYFAFMDADDYIDKCLYEDAVKNLTEFKTDIVVWGVTEEYFDESNKLIFINKLSVKKQICMNLIEIQNVLLELEKKTIFGYQWNHFYRAELIKKNKIYFEDALLYEDYFFNVRAIKHAESISILANTGYHYKKRMNDSITTKFVSEYFYLSRRRVLEMYKLYQNWNGLTTNVLDTLGNIYMRYILSAITRNWDDKAHMKMKDRVDFVAGIPNDSLYIAVAKNAAIQNPILKTLKCLINHEHYKMCCFLGWGIYYTKIIFPMQFSKIRRVK